MTTKFVVESHICNHTTTITSEMKNGKVTVAVDSTCKKIADYSKGLLPMGFKDLMKTFCDNPIYLVASSNHIDPNCLVPCGVSYCAWTEAGLVAKSLLARFDRQSIRYVDPSKENSSSDKKE